MAQISAFFYWFRFHANPSFGDKFHFFFFSENFLQFFMIRFFLLRFAPKFPLWGGDETYLWWNIKNWHFDKWKAAQWRWLEWKEKNWCSLGELAEKKEKKERKMNFSLFFFLLSKLLRRKFIEKILILTEIFFS